MFSTTTQYALRALAKLAEVEPGTAILGRDLARQADIPANYLSKVLLAMRNAGLLSASRGTGGGYRLERPPEEIRLIDVCEIFDAPRAKPSCLLGKTECSDEDACSAHEAWKEVRSTFMCFLESRTLADISRTASRVGDSRRLPGGRLR